jgi:endonuclease G
MSHHKHHRPFGKFESVSHFLDAYKTHQNKQNSDDLTTGTIEEQAHKIKTHQGKPQDIVEIDAVLTEHDPDVHTPSGSHIHLLITVKDILQADPDVQADVTDAKDHGKTVFVAIRIGDPMGIQEQVQGLAVGAALKLQGVWIPAAKAHAQGGEHLSVLHFTHHPNGFICTPVKCYQ